ncbi:hypothetical protein T08_6564 [Trichinella sp. T8]|nr:hypothetical protein T08_6564 [Trichinella sp. T8]
MADDKRKAAKNAPVVHLRTKYCEHVGKSKRTPPPFPAKPDANNSSNDSAAVSGYEL